MNEDSAEKLSEFNTELIAARNSKQKKKVKDERGKYDKNNYSRIFFYDLFPIFKNSLKRNCTNL